MTSSFLQSEVRETPHRAGDDLLSAGLGLSGLAGAPADFVDVERPTPAELRRRAIQTSWKGIADLGPLGGYGTLYGGVPNIPGREFQAFARLEPAHGDHRVLLQAPDNFDRKARCLLVTASSGSRGIYGPIALAGAWGLPRGCAVAYTDKGTGSGYFDTSDGSGVTIDGTRASASDAKLEFAPEKFNGDAGIAVKHAHSGVNPEADWGRHVLQAAYFGLAMLERAYPDQAPFTAANTRIIAIGLSNSGGAVLQAAGLDDAGMFAAVVALEPSVHIPTHGRALFDYATEAALLLPCALVDEKFADAPFARGKKGTPALWSARCASLHTTGEVSGDTPALQSRDALEKLHANGWEDVAIATAASTTAFDVWRAVAATYASAYLRRSVGNMPCGFSFRGIAPTGVSADASRAAWWSDASGIPPGAGVTLAGGVDKSSDPTLASLHCLRALWSADDANARLLRASVNSLAVQLPRKDLPIWIVHGASDGLIPTAFTSTPYVDWLRANGRVPRYWKVAYAQHFDAFLALPGFGDAHVPLLPYGYAVLNQMWAHVIEGAPLSDEPVPISHPRGAGKLTAAALGLKF